MNLTSKLDKKLQEKLIIIAVVVFFGLFFWLLTANVFAPPKISISQDISALTSLVISPDLKTEVVSAMRNSQSFDASELDSFIIYLDDPSISQKEAGFFVKRMAAREPFDLGFYALGEATASGIVELVN